MAGHEIGRQTFQIRNSGKDTLFWWKNTGTISHSQLLENIPFVLNNESGFTIFSEMIQFHCRYQKSNSEIKSFPICDSTFNYDTELYERVPGEYEQFTGNKFPDCLLSFFKFLPVGTILYFDQFVSICPDCVARKLPIKFQMIIIE